MKTTLNIKRKDVESEARYMIDQLTLAKKVYHDNMRILKKKKAFMESVKGYLANLRGATERRGTDIKDTSEREKYERERNS